MSEVVIKVVHLRKTFRKYKRNIQKMQHMLLLNGAGQKNNVFSDVSFEIRKGERVAIITKPGCGKTTMIQLLAGILKPEKGSVEVKGEITPVLDYKCGFDNSLTGKDNYEMRCALLGWPREVMKERENEIFKFAGLTKMKGQPMRNFKGPGVNRLGFTIATCDKPDILLFDEKFTFGNSFYMEKCTDRLKKLIDDPDVTLVMAANRLSVVAEFCTRGIILNEGKVEYDGSYEDASAYYLENLGASALRKAKEKEEAEREEGEEDEEVPGGADYADDDGSGAD